MKPCIMGIDITCRNEDYQEEFSHILRRSYAAQVHMESEVETVQEAYDNGQCSQEELNDTRVTYEVLHNNYHPHTVKRLEHAASRMKAKKLWANSFPGLEALALRQDSARLTAVIQILHYSLGRSTYRTDITDDVWMKAIDLTMLICEPELYMSGDMYGRALEPNLCVLYPLAILLSIGIELNSSLLELEQHVRRNEAIMARSEDIKTAIIDVTDTNDRLEAELVEVKAAAAENEEKSADNLAKAQKQIHYYELQLKKKEDEIQALRDKISELEEDLKQSDALNAELFPEAKTGFEPCITDEDLPELPEQGIVLAGGHVNMTNKIKQRHPGWKYIAPSEKVFSVPDCNVIFIWYKHLSHPVFDRIQAECREGCRLVYLESTNLDALELEIRRALASMEQGA